MGNSQQNISKSVNTEFGVIEIRRMPLKDYAELLRVLENVPEKVMQIFDGFDDEKLNQMSNMDFMKMLPVALAESWEDIIGVVAVPTDKDAEFLGKLDLADAVDVVTTILELNDIHRIISAVKKIVALKSKVQKKNPPQN